MTETRYTKDHEYVRVEGDVAVVGISDHAQQQLGDVVFVELPAARGQARQGRQRGGGRERQGGERRLRAGLRARSSRSTTDVDAQPGLINEDAMGRGWIFKIKLADPSELASLLSEADYDAFLKTLA